MALVLDGRLFSDYTSVLAEKITPQWPIIFSHPAMSILGEDRSTIDT
jgi:hypothetical protein